jgi:hypothetical protein
MIRRLIMVAALVSVSVIPALSAPHANAIPLCKAGYTCLYVYYSTVERTTAIGYTSIPCSGPAVTEGMTSGYFDFSEAECNS